MRNSLTFGKIFGIPIGVHSSWFLILVLLTWSLATNFFPAAYPGWVPQAYWLVGLLTSLLLFGSVLAHELGHSVVALREDVPVRGITLFAFGGVAQISREPPTAWAEFRIAAAGPLVSLMLGLILAGLGLLAGNAAWGAPAAYLGRINLLLVGFNLIPGFPLDGGRMLRAALWGLGRDFRSSTRIASIIGQGVAFLFILIGVFQMISGQFFNGLWIAFIGWFLQSAAAQSWQQLVARDLLRGSRVEQVMNRDCPVIESGLSLERLVNEYILAGDGQRCFFVTDETGLAGMITLSDIRAVAREKWPTVSVRQAMKTPASLQRVSSEDDLAAVLERMVAEDVNQMPVMDDSRLVGMVTREGLLRLLRTRAELGI